MSQLQQGNYYEIKKQKKWTRFSDIYNSSKLLETIFKNKIKKFLEERKKKNLCIKLEFWNKCSLDSKSR